MAKKKFGLSDWMDDHEILVFLTGFGVFMAIIGTSTALYVKYADDYRVYEDNQIICYNDESSNDKPNSRQDYYCLDRSSGQKVCEYGWSRGSHDRPPQGCYL